MASELSPLQSQLLQSFPEFDGSHSFVLSGAVGLSWGYLHHRSSEDLDFFSHDEIDLAQLEEAWLAYLEQQGLGAEVVRTGGHFRRFRVMSPTEMTLVDFVTADPPSVAPPIVLQGVLVDSLLDLAVNKLLALERREVKDHVDLYLLIANHNFDVLDLIEKAKVKSADAQSDWFPLEVADHLVRTCELPGFESLRLLLDVDREAMNDRLAEEGRRIFALFGT